MTPRSFALQLTAILALAAPLCAQSPAAQRPFAVSVVDAGGFDEPTQKTLQSLVYGELRRLGHTVDERPPAPGTQATGRRMLALRVAGRLGNKVPLFLEEQDPQGVVVRSVSLTAASIEECDIIIPRLVQSLLQHKPVEQTARMTTMTEGESRELRRKPGTSHFILGMNAPLYSATGRDSDTSGFSIGYLYDSPRWMVGAEAGSSRAGDSGISNSILIHAAYLFSDGAMSPYLGGGLGYLTAKEEGHNLDAKLGFRLSAGMEFFRLHRMRLQAGVDVYFPMSGSKTFQEFVSWDSTKGTTTRERQISARSAYPVFHLRVAF